MSRQLIRSISSRKEALDLLSRHLVDQKSIPAIFLDGQEWGNIPKHGQIQEHNQSESKSPCSKILFLGFSAWLEFHNGVARVYVEDGSPTSAIYQEDSDSYSDSSHWIHKEIIDEIERCSDPWKALELFRRSTPGYHAGYLSYELKNYRENLVSENPDPLPLPELWIGSPRKVIQIEEEAEQNPQINSKGSLSTRILERNPSITEAEYVNMVDSAKKKIHDGDYYEINLSVLFSGVFEGDPMQLYRKISYEGSQPFSAYVNTGKIQICSASPERFLCKMGDQLYSSPMKGTAARAHDPKNDSLNKKRLQESEKERAENLMIVDLVRNDFSRVCRAGTVKVNPLFEINSYPTVHQMISTVNGQLKTSVSPEEVIASCFPMGSMTGAPKITALRDIERLESYRRGVYSGAIGYFSPDHDFDFSVVIRTAFCQEDGTFIYPAGSAITSDADPLQEWKEILLKTEVLSR